jgi:ribosome maturation protein Sdo1
LWQVEVIKFKINKNASKNYLRLLKEKIKLKIQRANLKVQLQFLPQKNVLRDF